MNFNLDLEYLFCWHKQKKCFLWTMETAQSAENHGDGWGLNWYLDERYIHQFQPEPTHKSTSSSRSTEFKDILSWNLSQIITKTIPVSTGIVISYAMKRGISFSIWWKVSGSNNGDNRVNGDNKNNAVSDIFFSWLIFVSSFSFYCSFCLSF